MKNPQWYRDFIKRGRSYSFENELGKRTPNRFVRSKRGKSSSDQRGSDERA